MRIYIASEDRREHAAHCSKNVGFTLLVFIVTFQKALAPSLGFIVLMMLVSAGFWGFC